MTSPSAYQARAPLEGSDGAPWLILAVIGGVVGLFSLAWLGGTVGTWAGGGGWHPPAYTARTAQQLLDGQIEAVWPTGTRTWTLAGIASIAVAATTAAVLAALAATRRWGRGTGLARHRDLGRLTRATAPDAVRRLRPSLAHTRRIGADEAGLLLGDLHRSGREVRASWEDTVTAVMGPRARKSTALAVQALLRAPGPVVLTSNKADVYAVTTAVRAERGTVWTFDLQTIAHHPRRLWWDILAEARTLEGARRLASHFVATLNDAHKRDFWVSSATNTLTALFAAAAHHPGGTVADVLRWLAEATDREPVDRLKAVGLPQLAEQLGGTIRGAVETRDGIYETARQSIAALMDPRILAWVTPDRHQPQFDPSTFVASTDTVYLLSQDGIGSANGVVTAAVDAILQAGIRQAQRNGGRLDPPLARRGPRDTGKTSPRQATKPYVLRGRLYCGVCNRRMQAHTASGITYYRCRFAQEYALANKVVHLLNVYLREDQVLPKLDRWLARLFEPDNVVQTLDELVRSQDVAQPEDLAAGIARRRIADSDRKLAQHRAALEAGADPTLVAGWISEELGRKAEAEDRLRRAPKPSPRRLDLGQLAKALHDLGDAVALLGKADPHRKATIYSQLGVTLTYYPDKGKVLVTASAANQDPWGKSSCPRGDSNTLSRHACAVEQRSMRCRGVQRSLNRPCPLLAPRKSRSQRLDRARRSRANKNIWRRSTTRVAKRP
jgi:Type IV secretory system Conjugative DNA transfer/Recombinase zinc beta ribbon domain